jgi:L-alanine-DL-glutamate epimerase-like enolase superfamily enzyme
MQRRGFLKNVAVGGASALLLAEMAPAQGSAAAQSASTSGLRLRERPQGPLKISAVEVWKLEGTADELVGVNRQHQVRPIDVYDERRPAEYHETGPGRMEKRPRTAFYLKIRTDKGLDSFYGPIDQEAARMVGDQLGRFIVGMDPLAVETIWDQMHRLNRHSRAGHYMIGISAVDNALWDLRGRYFQAPVYQLLGGPTRPHAEVYGSCLGFSIEAGKAGPKAAELKKEGFRHQKWFMGWGPGDGPAGLQKNVAMVRELREAVGDDVDLMFDAFMGWDLNYAIAWAKQVEQYRPRWIEEATHVDKMQSFVELSRATSIPVATGEHFYGRWEVSEFLRSGAIRVVQADPEWCGGVSELVKICAIASAFDAHVIPHGHNLHASLHVVSSQSPMTCPLVEYLITKMENYYFFETPILRPVQGKIELPQGPGFGTELDTAKIEKQTLVTKS